MRRMLRLVLVLGIGWNLGVVETEAQNVTVTGRVTGAGGTPLAEVQVQERGTLNATTTGADGRWRLRVSEANAVLAFTRIGFRAVQRPLAGATTMDVTLEPAVFVMEAVEVVGSRRANRSALETSVPVDIIDPAAIIATSAPVDVNQLLQYAAPSFNATRQSGADGSDHIDPATLRGLGPDQTLVLVNGRRRHQSSLINIFGSRGRGNTGTDLNAIPLSAIERIEILRDGASAQYGSDAIAGVVNIVLKSSVGELGGTLAGGTHSARPPSSIAVTRADRFDGAEYQAGVNYGVQVGERGFINMTAEYLTKDRTNRPADPAQFDIYRRQFGDAALDNLNTFVNAAFPVGERAALYAFGGVNTRHTDAFAWSRDPGSSRNVDAIYPNGFDPHITSTIADQSVTVGARTLVAGWDVDLNNSWGANRFHFLIDGTVNASLLERSPTRFDAGGFSFSQNTTGISFRRLFPEVAHGVNVAFGVEHRLDRYTIFAGEEGSYRNYGIVDSVRNGVVVPVDTLGRPAGSQGFPGFQPANELDETRTNLAGFLDVEMDVAPRVTIGGAVRAEDYSDFGSTLNGKLAARVALTDGLALRGSLSSGFRAPSLAQLYFNTTFTDFVSGVAIDKLIARNNSPITRALGIPALREETATNVSLGLTFRAGEFSLTVDGYRVEVNDRVVLTGAFEDTDPDIGADLQALGVGAAQFFTNAIGTTTKGLDVIVGWRHQFGAQRIGLTLAGNLNDMELGAVNVSPALAGKEDVYFGAREQAFLLASAPPSRFGLTMDWGVRTLDATLRIHRFGRVTLVDWLDTDDVYDPRIVSDLSVRYQVTPNVSLSAGGQNLLNRYPTPQDTETETGGLWDAVQMGFSGAFYFARLNFRL